jgi:hypothetical protein
MQLQHPAAAHQRRNTVAFWIVCSHTMWHRSPSLSLLVTGAASVGALLLWAARRKSSPSGEPRDRPLPYPPDALPGSRDVGSPYGTTRVYEWGPVNGAKILLVHGISTPSIALAGLAHQLVAKGFRVMLFGELNCFVW